VFHGNIHRHLLTLSLANWAIAIISWTISAYLGTAQPTGIIVYTILFVIGIFAVVVAVACFVLADFGTEPHELATAGGPPSGRADELAGRPADPGTEAADGPAATG
jgi:hypothetical protein